MWLPYTGAYFYHSIIGKHAGLCQERICKISPSRKHHGKPGWDHNAADSAANIKGCIFSNHTMINWCCGVYEHCSSKETQLFGNCISFGEECNGSVCQVRRLGVVLLGVYKVSINMFPTYTIYINYGIRFFLPKPGCY